MNLEVIEYLKNHLNADELKSLIRKLEIPADELIRKDEEIFKPFKSRCLSESEAIELLVAHPQLIQRPIVGIGQRWVIARPIEKLKEIL